MKALLACAALAAILPLSAHAREAPGFATSMTGTVLYVVDPDRAVAFYRDALGLSLAMTLDHGTRREYMLRFSADPAQPGLILLHDSAADAPVRLEMGNGFSRLVLRVSDMDALAARLDAMKIDHPAPRDAGHGYRMMMITDPEGYRIEVIQQAAKPTEHRP